MIKWYDISCATLYNTVCQRVPPSSRTVHNTSPPPTDYVRQMNTTMSVFLWKSAIFRVPLSTLQRPRESGTRALIHILAKCLTLFMIRMVEARTKDRYFHCRLAQEVASTRKNTEPSTNKEDPNEIRLSLTIQHRIGISTHERNLQDTTLHSPPNKYTSCGWIPWTACPKTMAQYRWGTHMDKFKWCLSARKYAMYMVSSHIWHNSHQCTATPYPYGILGHLPAMNSDWYFGTSTDCLWRRSNHMVLHENLTSEDAANYSCPYIRRMDTPFSVYNMAFQKAPCNIMGDS